MLEKRSRVLYNKDNCFCGILLGRKVNLLSKSASKSNGQKKKRRSFILTLALIALVGYFIISLVSLQIRINQKQQELETLKHTYDQVQVQNNELKQIVAEDDENGYMERIARDILGYALPGESVYYDVSSGG